MQVLNVNEIEQVNGGMHSASHYAHAAAKPIFIGVCMAATGAALAYAGTAAVAAFGLKGTALFVATESGGHALTPVAAAALVFAAEGSAGVKGLFGDVYDDICMMW